MQTESEHVRTDSTDAAPAARALRTVEELLHALAAEQLTVAPHVGNTLLFALHGDARAIVETVRGLSESERLGRSFLPDPLPLTDAVGALHRDIELSAWQRDVLLAAAVCVDDRVDALLAISGKGPAQLRASAVSDLLTFVAGHFSFTDPRTRIWVHGEATLAERSAVHSRLAEVYEAAGEEHFSSWHRCLAEFEGDDKGVPTLLAHAEQELRAGLADHAFRVAREAAARATDKTLLRACTVAADAALAAGCLDDAVSYYERVLADSGAPNPHVLVAITVAKTVQTGVAPAAELRRWRVKCGDAAGRAAWAQAAGVVALLCAERGMRAEAIDWLTQAREVAAQLSGGSGYCAPAEAWTLFLLGEPTDDAEGEGMLTGTLCRALRAGADGDPAAGIRMLCEHDSGAEVGLDPLARCLERSPVMQAYRAVVEGLLWLWSGDLATARAVLDRAAEQFPLALPFAGLGAALLGRLGVAMEGRSGLIARALREVLPPTTRIDVIVDRAIESYLHGETEAAAVQVSLWAERGAPQACFALPGLDEVGPLGLEMRGESADASAARALRERVRAARESAWRRDLGAIAEEAKSVASPFERARLDAMLGTAYLLREDFANARRHLQVAQSLFDESGAAAWSRAAEVRLGRLNEAEASANRQSTGPILTLPHADPLDRCRMVWAPLLTERELEVAMLIAGGASNREAADKLTVSVRTVEVHAARVFSKLDVRTRAALTVLAYRTGHHA